MNTSWKIIPLLFFSVGILITSYRLFKEFTFYRRQNWNFNIDNEYYGTTFYTDGPHENNKESNKYMVLIGGPSMLFLFIVFFCLLVYA